MEKPIQPAEERWGVLRIRITAIRMESISTDGRHGYTRELSLIGTVPDDLGVEAMTDRPASISLYGGAGNRLEQNLDALHGISEGLSIGVIDVHDANVYVAAHVPNALIASVGALVRRGLKVEDIYLNIAFANATMGNRRRVESRHLLVSSLKRAAVLNLAGSWSRAYRPNHTEEGRKAYSHNQGGLWPSH